MLLTKIQDFFLGKGKLYIASEKVVQWKVFKLADLITISQHFVSHSLIGLKLKKFEIWKEGIKEILVKNIFPLEHPSCF